MNLIVPHYIRVKRDPEYPKVRLVCNEIEIIRSPSEAPERLERVPCPSPRLTALFSQP